MEVPEGLEFGFGLQVNDVELYGKWDENWLYDARG